MAYLIVTFFLVSIILLVIKVSTNTLTQAEKNELAHIKRLANTAGLLVLYSFFVVIGYTFQGTIILYLSELYFVFLLLLSYPSLYFFKGLVRAEQKTFAELALLLVVLLLYVSVVVYWPLIASFISPDFLIALLKLIALAIYGLIITDISETLAVKEKVHRSNLFLILGAFLLSIQLPTTLLAGLLFLGFGFATMSKLLRKAYFVELKTFKRLH